jgi:CheY-like chemotaxis protein
MFRDNRQQIDLVLLDLMMPDLHGEQVMEQVRAVSPGVPVILSSGQDRGEPRRIEEPPVPFIKKPYPPAELVKLIRQVLRA